MTEKKLDEELQNFEEEVENLKNKEFKLFGIKVTAVSIGAAIAIASSGIGTLYGAFMVYNDYQDMKAAIQEYVTPDLSELYKKIAVLEQNSEKSTEYVRDINTNLRQDIRRLEGVLESVERSQRTSQREIDNEVKEIRRGVDNEVKEIRRSVDETVRTITQQSNQLERETAQEIRTLRREIDDKIKQALDNPLAN
jgi:DNA anti-recombination protein RmuC